MVDQDPQLAIEGLVLGRIQMEGDVAAMSARTDLELGSSPPC
jgi:hypothetical protein